MRPTTPAYTKEWLADQSILCYRFGNTERITVDAWMPDLSEEIVNWPQNKPWRLMLDLRTSGAIVSAYGLRRSREIASMRPELTGRLAILINSKLAAQLISMAIRSLANNYRQRLMFASEAEAVDWLLQDHPIFYISRETTNSS